MHGSYESRAWLARSLPKHEPQTTLGPPPSKQHAYGQRAGPLRKAASNVWRMSMQYCIGFSRLCLHLECPTAMCTQPEAGRKQPQGGPRDPARGSTRSHLGASSERTDKLSVLINRLYLRWLREYMAHEDMIVQKRTVCRGWIIRPGLASIMDYPNYII